MKILNKSAASITVQLSRSNLTALLAKLDGHPPDSACTLLRFDRSAQCYLRIEAVEDDAHYADRDRGMMHPDTEAVMVDHKLCAPTCTKHLERPMCAPDCTVCGVLNDWGDETALVVP